MCNFRLIITFLNNWCRFSSSSWVEYFYMYYDDIVRHTYRTMLESVINS